MTTPLTPPSLVALLALAAALALPFAASAQSADNPPKAQRAHTLKSPHSDNKVLGGVQRGADATGRGIDRAGQATERGVNSVSERASRPVRNLGESIGRKLAPRSGGHAAPPPVGPQSASP